MPIRQTFTDTSDMNLVAVFVKLIQIILRERLEPDYDCIHSHQCLLHGHVSSRADCTRVVSIVRRGVLLERWMMSVDSACSQDPMDPILLLQSVYAYSHRMPLHTLLAHQTINRSDLDFVLASLDNTCPCSSCPVWEKIEFSPEARLQSHRFQPTRLEDGVGGQLMLEVVYDENCSPKRTDDRHATIGIRRLSRLSLSAMQQEDENTQAKEITVDGPSLLSQSLASQSSLQSSSFAMPIPSAKMQYTHHGHVGVRSLAYSTSPSASFTHLPWHVRSSQPRGLYSNTLNIPSSPQRRSSLGVASDHHASSLVGSYEESLLSGRMSTMPSKPIVFHCQIGVLGCGDCRPSLKCPPHLSIVFPALFYELKEDEHPTPYVGTVDLTDIPDRPGGYRLPPKGQLQIVIKNPNKTAVKLFLIPYDVSDMPRNTKTFLRQKSYIEDQGRNHLRYAIHVQICRHDKRIYLYNQVRVVFANRVATLNEKLKVMCEGPKAPVYVPLSKAEK